MKRGQKYSHSQSDDDSYDLPHQTKHDRSPNINSNHDSSDGDSDNSSGYIHDPLYVVISDIKTPRCENGELLYNAIHSENKVEAIRLLSTKNVDVYFSKKLESKPWLIRSSVLGSGNVVETKEEVQPEEYDLVLKKVFSVPEYSCLLVHFLKCELSNEQWAMLKSNGKSLSLEKLLSVSLQCVTEELYSAIASLVEIYQSSNDHSQNYRDLFKFLENRFESKHAFLFLEKLLPQLISIKWGSSEFVKELSQLLTSEAAKGNVDQITKEGRNAFLFILYKAKLSETPLSLDKVIMQVLVSFFLPLPIRGEEIESLKQWENVYQNTVCGNVTESSQTTSLDHVLVMVQTQSDQGQNNDPASRAAFIALRSLLIANKEQCNSAASVKELINRWRNAKNFSDPSFPKTNEQILEEADGRLWCCGFFSCSKNRSFMDNIPDRIVETYFPSTTVGKNL